MTERLNFYRMSTKIYIKVNLILDYLVFLKNDAVFLGHSGSRNLATQTTPVSCFLYSVSRIQGLQRASFRETMIDL